MTVPVPATSETGNPPTKEILATHTLAARTITQFGTPECIFDASSLDYLRRWVCNDTAENRKALLEEKGYVDEPGTEPGSKAVEKAGDLAGYVLARYGIEGDSGTLTKDEVELLKKWFEAGYGRDGE